MNSIRKNSPVLWPDRKMFTLIELLVVIAIIAILAGMLLPALGKTKEKAREIKCAGQVKQVAAMLIAYQNDYNQWTPHNVASASAGWPRSEFSYSFKLHALGYIRGADKKTQRNLVFECPESRPGESGSLGTGYGMRGHMQSVAVGWRLTGAKIQYYKISNSGTVSKGDYDIKLRYFILIGDSRCYSADSVGQAYYSSAVMNENNTSNKTHLPAILHGKRGNFALVDGHVESLTGRELLRGGRWGGYYKYDAYYYKGISYGNYAN